MYFQCVLVQNSFEKVLDSLTVVMYIVSMEATQMNAAWRMGYDDRMQDKPRFYENGPVGVVGVVAFDYNQGYRAANSDVVWRDGNRPPMRAFESKGSC